MSDPQLLERGKNLLVFGASGHAKVIIDLVEKHGLFSVRLLVDDNPDLRGKMVCGYEIFCSREDLLVKKDLLIDNPSIVAIGNNQIRTDIALWIQTHGGRLCEAVLHPSSQVARGVLIGEGSVVMAGTVINSDSQVGENVIVNTGAIVDHDCMVGNGVHVAPGVTLCGGISIGDKSLIGAGAIVLPNLRIGKNVTIGAGSLVRDNVPDGLTLVGTPARPLS